MEDALVNQRFEFLQLELEEYKKREADLKQINESLMAAVNTTDRTPLQVRHMQDQTVEELQRSNQQYAKELATLKRKAKQTQSSLEKQNKELTLANKELMLDLKQQKISFDSERYELLSKVQQLESDKLSFEKELKTQAEEKDNEREQLKYEFQLKLHEASRELDIQQERSKQEVLKVRQETGKTLVELKAMYQQENDGLRQQIKSLQAKMRELSEKAELLTVSDQTEELKELVGRLQEELAVYKSSEFKELSQVVSFQDKQLKETLAELGQFKAWTREEEASPNRRYSPQKFDDEPRLQQVLLELDRAKLTIQQLELDAASAAQTWAEQERSMTQEIKFLIGKLLKAKSKLGVEGELIDTVRKEAMLQTLKNRLPQKQQSVSPLNMSRMQTGNLDFSL